MLNLSRPAKIRILLTLIGCLIATAATLAVLPSIAGVEKTETIKTVQTSIMVASKLGAFRCVPVR